MTPTRPCTKKAYPSKITADFVIQSCIYKSQHNKKKKVPIRAYKCPHCRQWHATSQARKSGIIDNTPLQLK